MTISLREIVESVLRRHPIVSPEEQESGRVIVKRLHDLLDQTHEEHTPLFDGEAIDRDKNPGSGNEVSLSKRSGSTPLGGDPACE